MTARSTTERVSLAAVALPGGGSEVRGFGRRPCRVDDGWLRVESSGMCGTDISLHTAGLDRPTVLGHHVHGRIAELGDEAARRWGAGPGDWVVVEEYLPCGSCEQCAAGRYRLCPRTDLWSGGRRVGLIPVDEEPALWGGNAQYMYLPPEAVIHPLPGPLADGLAAWALPLANALDWVLGAGALRPGETVVVLGPGYHGLAAVTAALYGGAGSVVAVGLVQDRSRLEFAALLGAGVAPVADPAGAPEDASAALHDHVARVTRGRMADLVLDLTGAGDVSGAVGLLAQCGRLVLAGGRGAPEARLDTGRLTRMSARVIGVRGRAPDRVTQSIGILRAGGAGLSRVPTEYVPLAGVGEMLDRLAAGKGPATPHVVVRPWDPDRREEAR
ncbi:alcohol dehydrogenase catalytic domain-containing protein [Streptomyces microflavus]|uniref:alcohol dehydrogenase catalytic domain-containing protein n=1 Tax=Streptomyces microflavus TaxID=1919 RepID=UPI0033E48CBD